jgi:DNA-binding helix-hairpin-helix protein with protein kinase domain
LPLPLKIKTIRCKKAALENAKKVTHRGVATTTMKYVPKSIGNLKIKRACGVKHSIKLRPKKPISPPNRTARMLQLIAKSKGSFKDFSV